MLLRRLTARALAAPRRSATSQAIPAAKYKSYDDIPGPKPLPIVGNSWRFIPGIGTIDFTNFNKFSKALRDEYGDILKVTNIPGRRDMLILYDPEAIAQVYKNEGPWPMRFILQSVKHFRDKIRAEFFEGNQGLINENGEKWQQARTAINQPMMKIEVSNQYVPKTDEVAREFVKLMKQLRKDDQMPADFKNDFQKWALESIALIALDTRLGCLKPNLEVESDAQRMITAVNAVFELSFVLDFQVPIWKWFPTPTYKKFIKYEDDILEIAFKYVDQARRQIDLSAPDTPEMSVLHRILKRDPSTKRAVIAGMDIILAGVDTTSNSTATALYYLAKNPDKQEILYKELKRVVPSNPNEPLTAKHLDQMKYLKACIKEATRLTPVATSNVRVLNEDIVLNDYFIPAGKADVFMFNATLYADEQHYPDAKKFIPERWIRDEGVECPVRKANKTHPYVYLPFGHGARACPGMRFANMEMETLIARVLMDFKLEWHQPDLKFNSQFLQTPESPLKFTALDRK